MNLIRQHQAKAEEEEKEAPECSGSVCLRTDGGEPGPDLHGQHQLHYGAHHQLHLQQGESESLVAGKWVVGNFECKLKSVFARSFFVQIFICGCLCHDFIFM